jgi:transcriptional regulator with XRE-family HTH domain
MVEVHVLVKDLRRRLGLTQEQFAHEVGVTFSTVNQWENGHRRPQPFLLNKLLEMEAAAGADPAKPLSKKVGRIFRNRWEMVKAAEREELAATPMTQKLRQLAGLLTSAQQLGWTEGLVRQEDSVRERWAKLRQVYLA